MGARAGRSRLTFRLLRGLSALAIQRIRRQLLERDQLFQLISENAADMSRAGRQRGAAGCTTALPIRRFWDIRPKS